METSLTRVAGSYPTPLDTPSWSLAAPIIGSYSSASPSAPATPQPSMAAPRNVIPSGGWFNGIPSVGMFTGMQSAAQASATQTHPCQSGKGCECGGTCKGITAKVNLPPELSSEEDQKLRTIIQKLAADVQLEMGPEKWQAEVLRNTPGNSAVATAITATGDYLAASLSVDAARNILVNISELKSGRKLASTRLEWEMDGWKSSGSNSQKIPLSASLDGLATATVALAVVARKTEDKVMSVTGKPCDCVKAPASGQSICFPHDLKCTPAPGAKDSPWTSDHKHVQFWAPCVGTYKVNLGDCCFQHDIACFCARDQTEIASANLAVTTCFVGHIIAGAWTALGQLLKDLDWIARIFTAPFCAALIAAWQVTLLTNPLFGPLAIIFEGLYDALLTYETDAPCFFNFDHSHDNSCLCKPGGKPTIQCQQCVDSEGYLQTFGDYDKCTDLCKLAGKSESCYPCGWKCSYDKNGKSTSTFDEGPNGDESQCCPGTQYSCSPQTAPPCPECKYCDWFCDPRNGSWLVMQCDSSKNYVPAFAPCCNPDVRIPTGRPCLKQKGITSWKVTCG